MNIPINTIEEAVFMAKIAEQAERYEDMLIFLQPLMRKSEELNAEERRLISIPFKNLSGNKRTALRALTAIEENSKYEKYHKRAKVYKVKIEGELKEICKDAISVIDNTLLKNASSAEAKAFYLKMKADHYRYIGEVCTGKELEDVAQKAEESYETAKKAADTFPPNDPIRTGVALNYSVFLYDIRKKPEDACRMAKAALDEAVSGVQELNGDEYNDGTAILQMLRDNFLLWTSELEEQEEK